MAVVVNDGLIFRFPKRRDVEPQYQIERGCCRAGRRAAAGVPDVAFIWPGGPAYPHASSATT